MFLIAKHYLQNSASHCHARELHARLANFAAESIQAKPCGEPSLQPCL